jgi:hypothetical protein
MPLTPPPSFKKLKPRPYSPNSPPKLSRRPVPISCRIELIESDPDRDSLKRNAPYTTLVPPNTSWNKLNVHMIGVHHPTGAAVSPTLLSTERYEWLYSQHCKHTSSTDFITDLTLLMQRYHPRTNRTNPQGIVSKIANQWAITNQLASAIHTCFDTTFEIFASPLNSSMKPNVEYCTAFPEDANFGAHFDSFSYRLTGSCIANPEYEPEDMRKAVRHAIACAITSPSPLLVIFILPAWEDTPWRTQATLSHPNLSIIAHLQAHQLKFVPTHKQLDADLDITRLRPADWPVDVVMVANAEGRQAYLHHDRLQQILIPDILQSCLDPTQTITLFPQTHLPAQTLPFSLPTIPFRPLPRFRTPNNNKDVHFIQNPATLNTTNNQNISDFTNTFLPKTQIFDAYTRQPLPLYEIPQHPLNVLEIYGGTAAGLEALLRTGHYIHKYIWADTNPDAHTSTKHRLTQLHQQHPLQLPLTAITQWDNSLPLDPMLITTEHISTSFPVGLNIIIAGLLTYTPITKKALPSPTLKSKL